MIEKHVAAQQIERLSGLDWFPKEARAVEELISAIQASGHEIIAHQVITNWLAYERQCPKPADLRKLVWEENDKREAEQTPTIEAIRNYANCAHCHGFGIAESDGRGEITATASWCSCEAGQRRRREEPNALDRVNESRAKLRKRFGANPIQRLIKTVAQDPQYHGEF